MRKLKYCLKLEEFNFKNPQNSTRYKTIFDFEPQILNPNPRKAYLTKVGTHSIVLM